MKAILMTLVGLSLLPASAFAVRAKDCPETIQIRFGSVSALTVRQIIEASGNLEEEYDGEKVKQIRNALFNVRSWDKTLKIQARSSSYCQYLPKGESEMYGDNETRLVRKSGRDMLRVSIPLDMSAIDSNPHYRETVWVYLNLNKYAPSGVEIKPVRGAQVLGWHDHGSPRYHFGWVNDISAK